MHNPVGWFEIYVQDMERAKAFYAAVFEFEFERLDTPDIPMWAFPMPAPEGKGASGALVQYSGMASGLGGTLVYFTCEDCAVESGRVEGAGGRLQRPKMSIAPYGFIALAVDSEGNLIGLHSLK